MAVRGGFKDLFSAEASSYARYRPGYPPELFAQVASLVREHRAAWDCATGNGQAALGLAPYFEKVFATDPSEKQLAQAGEHPRVVYSRGSAEASGLPSHSVTLITVAQAFHWFANPGFFNECRRVARTGESALAIWMYNLARIEPAIDALIDDLYVNGVGSFWEPERKLVDGEYRSIRVPFTELSPKPVRMQARWSAAQLLGYIGTWSATQAARRVTGADPLQAFTPALLKAWGDPESEKTVTWALTLRFFSL